MTRPLISILTLVLISPFALADDSPLSLADLEAYRAALASKPDASAPPVRFRDLWDHPEAYAGRPVSVEGRVARMFSQPRIGEFPPLVEAWAVSPGGDPFCLIFSPSGSTPTPEIGASVRFSGTFIKRLKYEGADTPRVAPLIVGPAPPTPADSEPGSKDGVSIDRMVGVAALVMVGLVLARHHFARPVARPPDAGPPPIFADGEGGSVDESP